MDDKLSKKILDASRMSMGMDVSDVDISNVKIFASKIISLSDYRWCPPCLSNVFANWYFLFVIGFRSGPISSFSF